MPDHPRFSQTESVLPFGHFVDAADDLLWHATAAERRRLHQAAPCPTPRSPLRRAAAPRPDCHACVEAHEQFLLHEWGRAAAAATTRGEAFDLDAFLRERDLRDRYLDAERAAHSERGYVQRPTRTVLQTKSFASAVPDELDRQLIALAVNYALSEDHPTAGVWPADRWAEQHDLDPAELVDRLESALDRCRHHRSKVVRDFIDTHIDRAMARRPVAVETVTSGGASSDDTWPVGIDIAADDVRVDAAAFARIDAEQQYYLDAVDPLDDAERLAAVEELMFSG